MIRASVLAALFISGTAYACPQLAGDYLCTGASQLEVSITQREENATTIYGIFGYDIPMDGYIHNLPDKNAITNATVVGSCLSETEVVLNIKGNLHDDVADLTVNLTQNADGSLAEHNTGTVTRADGSVMDIDAPFTCVRK